MKEINIMLGRRACNRIWNPPIGHIDRIRERLREGPANVRASPQIVTTLTSFLNHRHVCQSQETGESDLWLRVQLDIIVKKCCQSDGVTRKGLSALRPTPAGRSVSKPRENNTCQLTACFPSIC